VSSKLEGSGHLARDEESNSVVRATILFIPVRIGRENEVHVDSKDDSTPAQGTRQLLDGYLSHQRSRSDAPTSTTFPPLSSIAMLEPDHAWRRHLMERGRDELPVRPWRGKLPHLSFPVLGGALKRRRVRGRHDAVQAADLIEIAGRRRPIVGEPSWEGGGGGGMGYSTRDTTAPPRHKRSDRAWGRGGCAGGADNPRHSPQAARLCLRWGGGSTATEATLARTAQARVRGADAEARRAERTPPPSAHLTPELRTARPDQATARARGSALLAPS